MKKFMKTGIVLCLLCGLLTTTAFAGDSPYNKYSLGNTNRNFQKTGSTNTKATTGADWFIQVQGIAFGGGTVSGTLGMAHAPFNNSSQAGVAYWTQSPINYFARMGWLSGYGNKGVTYELRIRLDDLIHPVSNTAGSHGSWNSN